MDLKSTGRTPPKIGNILVAKSNSVYSLCFGPTQISERFRLLMDVFNFKFTMNIIQSLGY